MSNNKKWKIFLRKIVSAVLVVALCIAIFLVFIAIKPGSFSYQFPLEITWDAFNASVAVLELYIVIFTLLVAILGFFGYQGLEAIAEHKAQIAVKKELEDITERAETLINTKISDTLKTIEQRIDKKIENKIDNIDILKLFQSKEKTKEE